MGKKRFIRLPFSGWLQRPEKIVIARALTAAMEQSAGRRRVERFVAGAGMVLQRQRQHQRAVPNPEPNERAPLHGARHIRKSEETRFPAFPILGGGCDAGTHHASDPMRRPGRSRPATDFGPKGKTRYGRKYTRELMHYRGQVDRERTIPQSWSRGRGWLANTFG